jgi:hypothetical protein
MTSELVLDRNPFSYIWTYCNECKEHTAEEINAEWELVCTTCATIKDRLTIWEVPVEYSDGNGEVVNSYVRDLDQTNYINTAVNYERLRFPKPANLEYFDSYGEPPPESPIRTRSRNRQTDPIEEEHGPKEPEDAGADIEGNVVWDEHSGVRISRRNRNFTVTKYIGYQNQFHFNEILAQISTQVVSNFNLRARLTILLGPCYS